MREKYESLALVQLKELAKVRGLKGTSTMKKAELVAAMLAEDERLKQLDETKTEAKTETNIETKTEVKKDTKTETKSDPKSEGKSETKSEPVRHSAPRKAEPAAVQGVRNESNYRAEAGSSQRNDNVSRPEPVQQAPRPTRITEVYDEKNYPKELDSGEEASGILEVMPDGYGFIR